LFLTEMVSRSPCYPTPSRHLPVKSKTESYQID